MSESPVTDIIRKGGFTLAPAPAFLRTLNRADYYRVMRWCRAVRRMMMKSAQS